MSGEGLDLEIVLDIACHRVRHGRAGGGTAFRGGGIGRRQGPVGENLPDVGAAGGHEIRPAGGPSPFSLDVSR